MVSVQLITNGAPVQAPPILQELESVFAKLDDSPLITQLIGPTRRGQKGYPVATLWRCFVAKHVMGLRSTEELRRALRNNPWIAQACGVQWPDGIPHHSTFSRFYRRLASQKVLPLLKDVSRALVRRCYAEIPDFGKRVAIDSTTIKAFSNGAKKGKRGKVSDQHAGWSVKKNTQAKTEYVWGYKLHLLVDCETELPIAANVSAGNVHDVTRASNVLSEARKTYSKFRPDYFMADAGYSSNELRRLSYRQYRARPIIDPNRQHKKAFAQTKKTVAWKALYRLRPAVERAYSRLKGQRSLNDITTRRRMKVTVHCYLSLIAMQVAA